jgi:ferric-dicitrate binding protein FerR (iron transport regulator)
MITRHLVFRYLSNQASQLERQHIQQWLGQGGTEQFFQWVEEWERLHPQMSSDTNHAWEQMQQRLYTQSNILTPTEPLIRSIHHEGPLVHRQQHSPKQGDSLFGRHWWWMPARIAAVLVVGIFLAVAAWFWGESWYEVGYEALAFEHHHTTNGQMLTLTLTDGSRVTLNANSKLSVPRFGFTENRTVRLAGEAEFSVTHTATNAPFVVATPSGMQVRVLGTEFVVFSRERGEKVALMKGSVQVNLHAHAEKQAHQRAQQQHELSSNRDTSATILLTPGDMLMRDGRGLAQVRREQDALTLTAWKSRRFHFNNTTIAEVAAQIHDRFGLEIRIERTALSERSISGSFPASDPDTLLHALAVALSCSVHRTDTTVIFH